MHKTYFRAFFLVPVIDVKVAKADTSFLTSNVLDTGLHNVPVYYNSNM